MMGIDNPSVAAPVPASARMIRISSVAYAVDDSASDANTASPTGLLIT